MISGEPELRSAAESGDREAMAVLARQLSAAGREAEATYWKGRLDEAAWADSAVPIGGRRYPPIVLLTAVLVGVLGLLAVAVVVLMYGFAAQTHDELLVPLLILLSIIPGAAAVAVLTGAVGMLRSSAAAARRARAVTSSAGGLGVVGALFLVGGALTYGGTAIAVFQAVLLGAAIVVPFFGVSALLGRCIPRLGVTRRPGDR